MDSLSGDRIHLTRLGFFGFHGVMPEENRLGQRFFIDLTCGLDLGEAGRTDALDKSVSYAEIYEVVSTAFGERRFQLIEALAQHVVDRLFAAFPPLEWIRITVHKPAAPIAMVTGEAAIEMLRRRQNASPGKDI